MSSARSRGWLVPLARAVALAAITLSSGVARADGPYEGTWREGPMRIDVAVTSWGSDCGPRPQSTSTSGGGTFQIAQEGDHLTFQMRSPRTTRGCWSENRAVRRVSSSAQAGTWRIVCRTPPDDSRGETGTYTLRAIGDDRITFRDVSAYDWQLNTSRCLATITTTQTFTRVSAAPTEQTPPEEEEEERCTPGAAARVIVRPASAELTPGGEQCFTTRVVDRRGCALRGQRVTLELAEGAGRIEGRCYQATDREGGARIVARAGALTDEARVSVRSVDLSDLIARRTETGSVGGGVPSTEAASADTEARVSATEREGIDLLWPALGLGLALLLVIFGVLALARRRKPPAIRPAEPDRASLYPEAVPPPDGEDMICPTCRRGFPPGEVRCSQDDTALVPYREFAAAATDHGNICPTCGARYPSSTKFCGKDGTTLEPATAENDTQ